MIKVDSNAAELFFCEYLSSLNIEFERQRLDVGDIIIYNEKCEFVLERKTWKDLSASICDGRWLEQQSRMNSNADDGNEKKKLFGHIIEGELIDWNQVSNMNPKAIWGALIKAQVRDGYYIFHSADKKSSADLVMYIQKQLNSDGFELKNNRIVSGVGHKRKRDNLTDPKSLFVAMLTMIPGISKQKADIIVEIYGSISQLQAASAEDISNIKYGERKMGKKLADSIKNIFF